MPLNSCTTIWAPPWPPPTWRSPAPAPPTLGEYPFFGLPAILVPYPYAWRYQKVNAAFLQEHGAALLLPDEEMPARLLPTVQEFFSNAPRTLQAMRRHAGTGSPRRRPEIAGLVRELAAARKEGAIMVSLDVLFWLFIVLFGMIGLMRGWAKEMMVTFSVILALFIITVLETYVPFVTKMVLDAQRPGGDPQTVFWLRVVLLVVLTFFGYQTPNIPKLAGSGRFARDRLQDALLGLFLGAVNGYLVWGTLWYFLDQAHYPFPGIVSPDLTAIRQGADQLPAAQLAVGRADHLLCGGDRLRLRPGGLLMMQHIHLIGIGGSGLSAIARVLLESGYTVSGSDRVLSPFARELAQAGAQVFEGHRAQQIAGADLVVRSSAVGDDNPEVQAARSRRHPRAQTRRVSRPVDFRQDQRGHRRHARQNHHHRHGRLGLPPPGRWTPPISSAGSRRTWASNAHAGQGAHFVIEADEYDRMFLGLTPEWILITHLEHDHPDCYPTMTEYRQAFVDFLQRLQPGGGLLTCLDHPETAGLVWHLPPRLPGLDLRPGSDQADYVAEDAVIQRPRRDGFCGLVPRRRSRLQPDGWPGRTAGPRAAQRAQCAGRAGPGAPPGAARGTGCRRPWVNLAAPAGASICWAKPAGSRSTLTMRIIPPKSAPPWPLPASATRSAAIWAVWQPHTYSRTQALFDDFIHPFSMPTG